MCSLTRVGDCFSSCFRGEGCCLSSSAQLISAIVVPIFEKMRDAVLPSFWRHPIVITLLILSALAIFPPWVAVVITIVAIVLISRSILREEARVQELKSVNEGLKGDLKRAERASIHIAIKRCFEKQRALQETGDLEKRLEAAQDAGKEAIEANALSLSAIDQHLQEIAQLQRQVEAGKIDFAEAERAWKQSVADLSRQLELLSSHVKKMSDEEVAQMFVQLRQWSKACPEQKESREIIKKVLTLWIEGQLDVIACLEKMIEENPSAKSATPVIGASCAIVQGQISEFPKMLEMLRCVSQKDLGDG